MDEVLHFIDGEAQKGSSGRTYENYNPTTGEVIGLIHEGGHDEVNQAVQAARAALKGPWGKMSVQERAERLYRVAEGVQARFEQFVELECLDTGKPSSLARHIDIPRGGANFKVFADLVKNVPTETFTMEAPDGTGVVNYGLRVPKGVIAVVSPWNLPLLLMTWKVAPALACGNTVIVKPSEFTPLTSALLGEVMNEAGIPNGVYNVVNGFGADSAGAYLTEHEDVDAITFTGETGTGSIIMKAAAKGIRDISFELGGKNASVVFADCDLDKAIEGTMRSAFANCGQVCLGTERVYVERAIFEPFVERLKAGAEALKIGAPKDPEVTLGSLVSKDHHEKVLSYYDKARQLGATVVTGGGVPDMPTHLQGGYWVEPTIWTGLSEDSPIIREEIFGPCCHIAPFDDEDEVVALANNTEYGLCSSVWTENLSKAHRVAAQMDCGVTWVNSWFLRDLRTAFGGAKQSGIGREGGVHSLEFYTELRNVCVKL